MRTRSCPAFRDLDRLAQHFGTSRQATAKRYVQFAKSACALVECKGADIQWVTPSASFRAEAVQRRALEPMSFAAALSRGESIAKGPRRVAAGTWGSDALDVEMIVHATVIPESGQVIVWLWHAPVVS